MNIARTAAMALGVIVLIALGACSREQRDWRAAQAADTIEAYDQFIVRHPDSELVTQARSRIVQLAEERDWERATGVNTPAAYREFLAQYPNGRWAQEARIRIESFALSETQATQPAVTTLERASATTQAPATMQASVTSQTPAAVPTSQGTSSAAQARTIPAAPAAPAPASQPVAPAPQSQSTRQAAYGIQLGAFGSSERASSEWQRLEARFGAELRGLSPHVEPVSTAAGRLYRLQADVGSEARARAICESLKKQSQGCVVVLP